jgi:threonine aldolase
MENAHSLGRVVSLAAMDEIRSLADEWGLPVHLDGARIFNAASALKTSAGEIAARADSVMFCLSKGLCAPVGSLLAGTRAFIEEARYKRKVMGGGMRQAGVLAAAGILALKEHPEHLKEDHQRAQFLAQKLAEIPGIAIKPEEVEINMIFFSWKGAEDESGAARVMEIFERHNVCINPPERGRFRFVTHFWIGDAEAEAVLEASREAFGEKKKTTKAET